MVQEGLIGLSTAARLLGEGRGGRPKHPATLSRWCSAGVGLPGGRRVRLEHVRVGGRVLTSRDAVLRFLAAQQPAGDAPFALPRSPAARTRASAAAADELDRAGL